MEALEKLGDAVNRICPRAILILDTNTVMNPPRLESYEIGGSGPFLLVVPRIVDLQLMSVKRGGKDERTRQKASRSYSYLGKLYDRGNPATGIDLGSDRWLITVNTPKLDSDSLEDDQVRRNLGRVDASLLELTRACAQNLPSTSTLLITEDMALTRQSSTEGVVACELARLRSSESLQELVPYTSPNKPLDIEAEVAATVDPNEERLIRLTTTLEELRSESEDLVARGSGRLTYNDERFSFRWTFPYKNLAIYNFSTDEIPISSEYAVMPIENVDFMGADDEIPEGVRRYVCSMLEDEHESMALQLPLTRILWYLQFHIGFAFQKGEPYGPRAETHKRGLSPEAAKKYDELSIQHDQNMQSLFDRSAKSVGSVYRAVFELNETLENILGWDEEYDLASGPWDLETSLIEFLDDALGTWAVGDTREAEYTYRPFAWLEEREEALVDDEDEPEEEST